MEHPPQRAASAGRVGLPAGLGWTILSALVVTAFVTAASYLTPEPYAATAVGVVFLGATWLLVLRHDAETVSAHGLALGGLLLPEPLDPRRLIRSTLAATALALVWFAVIIAPFFLGYSHWFKVRHGFDLRAAVPRFDVVMGQLLVIALPEEAFFRGFLQSRLDVAFPTKVRVLGLPLGLSTIVASLVFAVGHLLTIPAPARLAVFFPALLFGGLRSRTGGIGASVLLHALCNLLSGSIARGYGLSQG